MQKLQYNTTDNNSLDDTTNPQADDYDSSDEKVILSGQEIWQIENNEDNNHTVNFVYKKTTDKLTLDEEAATAETITPKLYVGVETNKTLLHDKYNTLWLPFNMNHADIKKIFGEGACVYKFTGVTTTGEGADASTTLNFEDITNNGLPAYTPVIVTLGSNDVEKEIAFESPIQVETEPENGPVTVADGWQFVGTTHVQTIAQGDFYLKNNKYYESTGNATIKAYRAYFKAPEGSTLNANHFTCDFAEAPDKTTSNDGWRELEPIDLNDTDSPYIFMDNVTRVEKPTLHLPENDGFIYNLNGQKVGMANQINVLPKGIYMIGGSKYIVK